MVELKETKGKNKKSSLPNPVKLPPKLQFASSDEDDDDEEELSDEEVDIDDEEMDDEGLDSDIDDEEGDESLDDEDDDDDDDEEEDEEEEEEDAGPLTKTPKLNSNCVEAKSLKGTPAVVNAKGDSKTPKSALKSVAKVPESAKSKKNVDLSAIPSPNLVTKTPSTPHPTKTKSEPASAKVVPMEVDTPMKSGKKAKGTPASAPVANETPTAAGKKRKANGEPTKENGESAAPAPKLARPSEAEIRKEEKRRLEHRNSHSLFVKNAMTYVRKSNELKALHPEIAAVRVINKHAWLLFPSAASCTKALESLRSLKLQGRPVTISHASNNPKKDDDRPIDLLQVVITGIPNGTDPESLKTIFPACKEVSLPPYWKDKRNLCYSAYLSFATETDALAAFNKGASLKIAGTPVEVFYGRVRGSKKQDEAATPDSNQTEKQKAKNAVTESPVKNKEAAEKKAEKKAKQQQQQLEADPKLLKLIAEKERELAELKKLAQKKGIVAKSNEKTVVSATPKANGKPAANAPKTGATKVNANAKAAQKQKFGENSDDEEEDDDDVDSSDDDVDSSDDDEIPSSDEGIQETDSEDEDDEE